MHIRPRPVATSGNAIVIAMGAFTIAAVLVATAVDGAVIGRQTARQSTDHQQVLAALDAVLAKREKLVVERASQGDPAEIARWDGNFGVDFVGGTEVRWKIEPVRTPPRDANGTPVHHIANPPPDPNWTPPTTPVVPPTPPATVGEPAWEANDTNFLFRIAGEARLGRDSGGQPTAVVQGARYCSVLKEPLFRYVIFYAARGPKGDLELSHADPVNIQGAVHSNGALYIGGGLKVNDRVARLGSIDGSLNPTSTSIGPDVAGKEVRVNGVDGIFRLSKPLMFSLINEFPLTNSATASTGSPTDTSMTSLDWTAAGSYDVTGGTSRPSDPTGVTWDGTVAAATADGRLINPYRIKEGSAAVTENKQGNQDDLRRINNVAIRGAAFGGATSGDKIANDARDAERSAAQSWNSVSLQTSAPGFAGYARTRQTGQGIKNLPERMRDRGLDPQRLAYPDFDGDPTTDEHHLARPRFMKADGTSTTEFPTAGRGFPQDGSLVYEEPGQYLRYALGSDQVFMQRDSFTGRGWRVRRLNDTAPTSDPNAPGIIIRERPIPEPQYWPGSNPPSVVAPSSERWLPFAYGKHFFPSTFRFTVADITDRLLYNSDPWATNGINPAPSFRSVNYSASGRLTITAAQAPDTGTTGTTVPAGADPSFPGYSYRQYYYGQNWRFVHLGQSQRDTSMTGLRLTVFNDRPGSSVLSRPLSNEPADVFATAIANGVNFTAIASPTGYRSARFDGFLTAPSNGSYLFALSGGSAQQVRLWINGNLRATTFPVSSPTTNTERLTANTPVPIQIDWINDGNSTPAISLTWVNLDTVPLPAPSIVPASALNPPVAGSQGFARADFRAIQLRIDNRTQLASAHSRLKTGIMIRDATGGMSPTLDGSASYVFLGYAPSRGFFTERRLRRHLRENRSYGTFFVGNGSYGAETVDPDGTWGYNSGNATPVVTRSAILTQTSLVDNPQSQYTGGPYNENHSDSTSWTSPAAFTGTTSRDVGGGKVWTLIDPFSTGARTGTRTIVTRTRVTAITQRSRVQTVTLSGNVPAGVFTDLDAYDSVGALNGTNGERNRLYIYTNATGTATTSSGDRINYNASIAAGSAEPTTNSRWYLFGGTSTNRTQLKRYYSNTQTATAQNIGGTFTFTKTVGTADTIWGTPRISKNGVVTTATLAEINTVTGGSFTSMNPSLGSVSTSGLTYPAAPAYPAYPAGVTPNPVNMGSGRTFQVQRDGATVPFNLNSFVTASSTWFTTAQPQWLPWSTLGTWAAITPPNTNGFRPDLWSLPVAPASGSSPNGITLANGHAMTDDVMPAGLATATEVWLRIEHDPATNLLRFKYFVGTAEPTGPTDPGWTELHPATSAADIGTWGTHLLAGPAMQSGAYDTGATTEYSNMRIEMASDVIDATDWNQDASGQDINGLYLASQYQVWWGAREITEDFFTWEDPLTGQRIATEEWIWNPREFWSQSCWWDHLDASGNPVSKDPAAANFTNTRIREALAKTTLLTLDMAALQNYLRTRLLTEAIADRLSGGSHDTAMGAPSPDYVLASRFNGLIYAARTNRYPWNPNANPALPALLDDGAGGYTEPLDAINPWSATADPSSSFRMPNSQSGMAAMPTAQANNASLQGYMVDATYNDLLQPYSAADLPADPPLRPEQFHHGVRLKNAASIDWGFSGTRASSSTRPIGGSGTTATTWAWTPQPEFGVSKTSIVTPNALYVQGNFNVDQHIALKNGVAEPTFTPTAIMGDSITLLSNAWDDNLYRIPGLTISDVAGAGSVSGTGTLACATLGATASDTEYNVAIATHNQPSTRNRVAEGQSAPFVDTTMFLENWNGREMSYMGSLVVMDSRRYTRAFLHDTFKTYGQTPFGIVDNDGSWLAKLNAINLYGSAATVGWLGRSPVIYSEPTRVYQFNYDLLTEEGTPPFAPFGVSTSGVGGWARIIR